MLPGPWDRAATAPTSCLPVADACASVSLVASESFSACPPRASPGMLVSTGVCAACSLSPPVVHRETTWPTDGHSRTLLSAAPTGHTGTAARASSRSPLGCAADALAVPFPCMAVAASPYTPPSSRAGPVGATSAPPAAHDHTPACHILCPTLRNASWPSPPSGENARCSDSTHSHDEREAAWDSSLLSRFSLVHAEHLML
jgi:hypothetical protein